MAPQVALGAPHEEMPQVGPMSVVLLPEADTAAASTAVVQRRPGPMLPCTVTRSNRAGPADGAF
jgi:hypothetical protein